MKHLKPPTTESGRYYWIKWRHHSLCFIVALALLANAIIWAVVSGFYGITWLVIVCLLSAVFALFGSVIEYRECERYHLFYLRSICEWTLIDHNHTNQ